MKKYFLFVLTLCASQLFSQTKFGISTYTVPSGWRSSSQGSSVVLESSRTKSEVCRITIFATEKAAVNTAGDYIQHRSGKNGTSARFDPNQKKVVRTEANGMIGFSSGGAGIVNEKEVRVYFYSFTNGSETFFIELIASSNDCIQEFNKFLNTLLVDPVGQSPSGNNLRRKKAAPAAVPAAPAPMM
jgi:hypothetical protein